jgi:predicted helicase
MSTSPITATHRSIRRYYEQVAALRDQRVLNEMNVRSAFEFLLADAASRRGWTFIAELSGKSGGARIVPDGTLRDRNSLPRGYWEAKDTQYDLDTEIKKKIARGYPLSNIIFEDTQTGVLFQSKQKVNGPYALGNPKELAALLNQFFSYTEPDIEGFEEAVDEFKERVPELARGLVEKIQHAHRDNPPFQAAFEKFFDLCRTALNPNIRVEAVDEMLVQHLLTERLFRTVFNNPEFVKRNAIAAEVERVIEALVSKSFDRTEYLKSLDRFYRAIEGAARLLPDFSEKQHFLNTVYERFFQGYSVKLADTMGIVYTPQEIVNFMCASVAEVLEKEFGKSLSSPDVFIIDPCTGTGNFVVNLLRRMPGRDLPRVYREQLFANEVMLLPYYIATLNIEHAYFELTETYDPFEGLCFVDTLDLTEASQPHLHVTQTNSERVARQQKAPITIVIGNPPYNMNQQNENDNNKNRKYKETDKRVADTYSRDSKASNKGALSDPFVKFFRWATDRLRGRDGIVCFVSNNSFVDQQAFDGMRKNLLNDFTSLYHVDLHGNVRRNPKLSGTTHNVFGIRVGVGITVAVRNRGRSPSGIHYFRVPETWRKEEKLNWLDQQQTVGNVKWLNPAASGGDSWGAAIQSDEFELLLPIATKEAKQKKSPFDKTIFRNFSRGLETCRDEWTYAFEKSALEGKVNALVEAYNAEIDRWRRAKKPPDIDDFVTYDPTRIKWCSKLKQAFEQEIAAEFKHERIKGSLYRPYTRSFVYVDPILTHRRGIFPEALPVDAAGKENLILWVKAGTDWPFFALVSNLVVDVLPQGGSQCFPFYIYNEDGTNRRENITNWALEHFRNHYNDEKITKWDIFYYVYGILHHPEYRAKYAENLKRELPRIPLATDFWGFSKAGEELARLHVEYESLEPYPLRFVEASANFGVRELAPAFVPPKLASAGKAAASRRTPKPAAAGLPLSYRVEDKMRLAKDHRSLKVNDTLTLGGIPPETFEYRLGNRSALEWVIDQYQVTEDKQSGIRSDPNRADDPEYIVRLVGQVVRVSMETVMIVKSLPCL